MPKSTKSPAMLLADLKAKKTALEARIRKAEAMERQKERKLDTRRKILIGAIVQNRADNDPAFAATLNSWLDDGLTNDRDRQLFNLPFCDTKTSSSDHSQQQNPAAMWSNVAGGKSSA